MSKPCDYKRHFPGTGVFFQDEDMNQDAEDEERSQMRPYSYDEVGMIEKLGERDCYQNSYFTEGMKEAVVDASIVEGKVEQWCDNDQYQLCTEAMRQCDFRGHEIEGLCFKAEQMSTQQGIRKHGERGKASALKEMQNFAVKNEMHGEMPCKEFPRNER